MKRFEPMFLNPVIRAKTYTVWGLYEAIGEVNASNPSEAWDTAKSLFGQRARAVFLKKKNGKQT